MSETLFKEVHYSLGSLISDIGLGRIGLPDIQRPFVWANAKVRDLFDSMYRGYPVGYFLFWQTGAEGVETKVIGDTNKQKAPSLLIVDGQQRLTSLYAVIRREAVLRENFEREHIRIAFRPQSGTFAVPDATTERDPEFILDISEVFNRPTHKTIGEYLKRLTASRDVSDTEEEKVADALGRLAGLTNFPFIALELSQQCTEEQVADVFVRINSEGKKLNQSDFILTLMSVFWDDGRTELEKFCRGARQPAPAGRASPFNQIFQPDPDHLLRVDVGVAFRRARLEHVYSLLRGKDLASGEVSLEQRNSQFDKLRDAQGRVLNLTYWSDFLNVIRSAGYRSAKTISSVNALVFAYQLYLLGRTEYDVEGFKLRNAIARWLFMSLLTGRFTSSPESRMEQDLAELRELKTADQFLTRLATVEAATLTDDYWTKTLPLDLATSAGRSPALFGFYAAQVLLGTKALFSQSPVVDLLDPPAQGQKKALERHHLFPKQYLKKQGIESVRDINQIANYALVEWDDNIAISDSPPGQYWGKYAERFDQETLTTMMQWHALPAQWWMMSYDQFLVARRPLIADVIRQGYQKLVGTAA
ncbi:GmrSD restriction endonuclease domain-containing protein [Achromobacter sp. AGC39]